MPRGVASAKQLAMMAKVLDSYCHTHGVTDASQREDVATLILELFNHGFRDEEVLLTELMRRRFLA
jgi:hypothetical protein